MGQRRREHYYIAVSPEGMRHSQAYQAFVPDPDFSGRFIRTHQCVLFTACPTCGVELYIPCLSAHEKTRSIYVRGRGWIEQEYRPHVSVPCLSRRAKWRDLKQTNAEVSARHREHLAAARNMARKAHL